VYGAFKSVAVLWRLRSYRYIIIIIIIIIMAVVCPSVRPSRKVCLSRTWLSNQEWKVRSKLKIGTKEAHDTGDH